MSEQPPGTPPASPKASRTKRPRWLDPKLIIGVLFVLISTGLGARIITQADAMVEVWAVKEDQRLAVDGNLDPDALTTKRVRFSSGADGDRYVGASSELPDGARMVRGVGPGELLPRHSFATEKRAAQRDLALPVEDQNMPVIKVGDKVDVYVVPEEGGEGAAQPATEVLDNATVVGTPEGGGSLSGGESGKITVRVNVDEKTLATIAGQVATGTSYVARRSAG